MTYIRTKKTQKYKAPMKEQWSDMRRLDLKNKQLRLCKQVRRNNKALVKHVVPYKGEIVNNDCT